MYLRVKVYLRIKKILWIIIFVLYHRISLFMSVGISGRFVVISWCMEEFYLPKDRDIEQGKSLDI